MPNDFWPDRQPTAPKPFRLRLGVPNPLVEVNGHDITPGIIGVKVALRTGDSWPRIEIEVGAADGAEIEGEAEVVIDDPTRHALVSLGWTPPTPA